MSGLTAVKSSALHPFPPRIRLRVGVSGHRVPPKLPIQSTVPLRALIDRVLATIVDAARNIEKDYAACSSPAHDARLRTYAKRADFSTAWERAAGFAILSSLAEGADRIVAEAGLAAGFGLEVVLPLGRAEYAHDFETQESVARFEQLLARASAVFELDGAADERPRAYETAGFVMLSNIDLLIAIWDGEDADGIGGTAQIVARAIADGVPVMWINPANPNAMQIRWPRAGGLPPARANMRPEDAFQSADEATIALMIKEILSLPTQVEARKSLKQYLVEKERHWNFCPWNTLLLWLFAGRPLRLTDFHLPEPLAEFNAQWETYLRILPKDRAQRPAIESVLLPAFSVADHLAVYYSLVYRSTYIFNFLFAAVAVALALGGIFVHDVVAKSYLVFTELVIIIAILITWLHGHRKQWHRRWLEYRRLAECLRHMRILAPLGSAGPVDRPGRNLDVDEQDWVSWYAWSLRRLLPLPDRSVDAEYLAAMREAVRSAEIAGQLRYHTENASINAKLDPRMQRGGQVFFGITGGICVVFLCFVGLVGLPNTHWDRETILGVFTFLTALLPTLGAALGAIHVQGDFKTVAEQSSRTAKRLSAVDKILADEPLDFALLADRVEKASDIMMADLLEWQTVFRTRPLSLPA